MATSCDSLLDIDPPSDSMTEDKMYSSVETIKVAANGLYTHNFLNNFTYFQVIELNLGLCSDELRSRNSNVAEYEDGSFDQFSGWFSNQWRFPYQSIYQANDFINHVEATDFLDENTKNGFLGQARYFRAYAYFMLVNAFGDVPLILSTDVNEAAHQTNVPASEINKFIIEDLEKAEKELKDFEGPTTRITREAIQALLSRVYLYTERWKDAKNMANKLIPTADGGSGSKFQLETINKVFKSSSKESILSINMEGFSGPGTYSGYTRIGTFMVDGWYYLSQNLVKELQKDAKDLRNTWTKPHKRDSELYCPYKYQNRSTPKSPADAEYLVLLRLGEQYLIRAEANAQLGNTEAALNDINLIRNRAGVDSIESVDNKEELMLVIEHERRKELFGECGHRWYDLRRTHRANAVYSATDYKKNWKTYKTCLPIPDLEIARNPALKQNEGY